MTGIDRRRLPSKTRKTALEATVSAAPGVAPRRRRQTPPETRGAAIEAARKILIERGPQFVTLQSVAQLVGMSHSNIAHHFGSSGALRGALVDAMVSPIMQVSPQLARKLRNGTVTETQVVAAVFAAFGRGGIGALIAWMAAEGEISRFDTVFGAISRTVQLVRKAEPAADNGTQTGSSSIIIATLVTSALGAALIGTALEDATGVKRGAIERQAAQQLHMLLGTTAKLPAPPAVVKAKPVKR